MADMPVQLRSMRFAVETQFWAGSTAGARLRCRSNYVRLVALIGIALDPKPRAFDNHACANGHRLGLLKDPGAAVLHANLNVEVHIGRVNALDGAKRPIPKLHDISGQGHSY
jgi:hypothetical protein